MDEANTAALKHPKKRAKLENYAPKPEAKVRTFILTYLTPLAEAKVVKIAANGVVTAVTIFDLEHGQENEILSVITIL